MQKVLDFVKKEAVLIISLTLCVVSMFFVAPSKAYIDYIDIKTLALLFSLMTVMAGLQALGVFKFLAQKLLEKANKSWQLYLVLTLLCFFPSMIITNDVALITFVPFTIVTLNLANQQKRLPYFIIMQTIGANLGSMITPIGNPQNLYLFSSFNMNIKDFLSPIFPFWLLSLLLLIIGCAFAGKEPISGVKTENAISTSKWKIIFYIALFLLILTSVFRVLPYQIMLIITLISVLAFDRKSFKKVDYSLLFTFVFLFIFIGNLGKIDVISNFLKGIVDGNEVLVGIGASQVFSNVPACILLSSFTDNAKALLIGVNLGGLGTLIASMASLISYKFVQKEKVNTKNYILMFTLLNILFLALNLILFWFLHS